MDALEAINKRISVRVYTDRKIEKVKLEQLIEAARQAPTARAIEPWEFIVVTDKDKIRALAEITDHGKFMKDATCCIALYCQDTKYYLEDGAAATENILIAATALGIGSCWIAGDKKPYASQISKALDVPRGHKLVSLISLGFAKDKLKKTRKRKLVDLLHWQKF